MNDARQRVIEVLDQQIRPWLQSNGGDIELVELERGVAVVRLHGFCSG